MFLTRKALKRIRLLTGLPLILCVILLMLSIVYAALGAEPGLLVVLGMLSFVFGIISRRLGRYAEGKGNLINLGNRLVCQQLRPAEFIRLYEEARDCPENVIAIPDFDVLRLVLTAYDAMGDTEQELKTLDEMYAIVPEKKKPLVDLLKCSVLFSIGETAQAEELFWEASNKKTDLVTKATADLIQKSDRAMAIGDFATAEAFYRQTLERSFPKNTPLYVVSLHFGLARVCDKTGRQDEANLHYRYCVENGGETAIRSKAAERLGTGK